MRPLLLTLWAALVLSLPTAQADDSELRIFRIGTGGVSGTYYPIGGIIGTAISNPPGARTCERGGSCGPPGLVVIAQSANGSVANVEDIAGHSLESGFVQSDIAYWAYTGTGTFEDREPMRELRTIANLYQESIHIVARRDSGIRSIRDLVGRRVSLDEPGSGTLVDALLVLREYGIDTDDIEVEYLKSDLAIERVRNGRLDAFFIVAGYPARAVTELAQDTELVLLPIDGPEAEQLVEHYGFFTLDHIPAGVYPGVARARTISVGAQWLVNEAIDEELIYGITRTLWHRNSRKLLDNGHAKGREITLDNALSGIAVPLHPGARRFYREIGLLQE